MDSSFINLQHLRFLFISDDNEDLSLANEILEQKKTNTNELDEILEELNSTYSNWHFL